MNEAASPSAAVPKAFHVIAALAIVAMIVLARLNEPVYDQVVQEDRFVEWLTVAFFLGAAAVGLVRAIPARAVGDALVALFCSTAAGEEVSWGQRFIGFTPPDVFLANNTQQEANLHNLFEAFGQPKWTLIALLAAYGIALPLAYRIRVLRGLAERMRMTPPPAALVPWYAVAILLLITYPVRFTGEWVEALAAALFFFSARPSPRVALAGTALCVAMAIASDRASGAFVPARARAPELVACARQEATAFQEMLRTRLPDVVDDRMHRRVWSVWNASGRSGVLPDLALTQPTACGDQSAADATRRRRYGIDPWGSPYWVRVTREAMSVYSFGPNRRRDVGASAVDDIVVTTPTR